MMLGIALAVASKPAADKPAANKPGVKPKAPTTGSTLDCKVLERQLSKCGPAIAAAFDSGLGARLAKHPPLLRGSILRTISQEFVTQVAGPCFVTRGRFDQAKALQSCLATAKAKARKCPAGKGGRASAKCRTASGLEQCRALAKCLALKVSALPRPKKKATPPPRSPPKPSTKSAPQKK
jgi:hypothetical protein